MMRGGHLAILRSGFGSTKESEVAAGDIVPVRACEYELADTGRVLGRVLPDWCLAVPGDSLRA
jgi:hypothetical protein